MTFMPESLDDLNRIVRERLEETIRLEFKRELPPSGKTTTWRGTSPPWPTQQAASLRMGSSKTTRAERKRSVHFVSQVLQSASL